MDYHTQLVTNNLHWLERVSNKEKIFHYSKCLSAECIIRERSIRAYDIWSMNDIHEFQHGVDLFYFFMKKRNLGDIAFEVRRFIDEEKINPVMKFFSACFTRSELKKKHWKLYANDSSGVCLRFNKDDIRLPREKLCTLLGSNVIYKFDRKEKLYQNLIDSYIANYKKISKGKKIQWKKDISELNLGLFQAIVTYSLLFKRLNYRWEDEFRLIAMIGDLTCVQNDPLNGRDYINLYFTQRPHVFRGCKADFENYSQLSRSYES